MSQKQKQDSRCEGTQVNPKARDFDCRLTTAHSVHVDSVTGLRWGYGSFPRGWNRRWKKNYGNAKLHRQSLVHGRAR